jgi:cobalt-zinc-cadmium efflux system membrane fusion protein
MRAGDEALEFNLAAFPGDFFSKCPCRFCITGAITTLPSRTKELSRLGVSILVLIGVGIAALVVGPRINGYLPATETKPDDLERLVQVAAGQPNVVRLDPSVVERLPITTRPVQSGSVPLSLELSGTLMLDPDKLSHVHSRFSGEVVEVGTRARDGRPIAFGMPVSKGQLLAVIWSRELGEEKSELVDALSRLWLDEETLAKILQISLAGAIPERTVREAQRQVESDRIAVAGVERTMEAWRLSPEEIQSVRDEARRLLEDNSRTRHAAVADWARIEIRSPLDGVIMERNFSLGDLVDTADDLFLVAQLGRLRVMAHAYEENLSALDALPPTQRQWSLAAPAEPAIALQRGEFEQIGRIIDPNQHTALVMGWVDNSQGQLRVGQFVTATIEIPTGQHEVAVPTTAVVDQGSRAVVFVQSDPHEPVFTSRQVAVTRRTDDVVLINGQPTAGERARGAKPLVAGELVVVSGLVQLASSLHDRQSSAAPGK